VLLNARERESSELAAFLESEKKQGRSAPALFNQIPLKTSGNAQ